MIKSPKVDASSVAPTKAFLPCMTYPALDTSTFRTTRKSMLRDTTAGCAFPLSTDGDPFPRWSLVILSYLSPRIGQHWLNTSTPARPAQPPSSAADGGEDRAEAGEVPFCTCCWSTPASSTYNPLAKIKLPCHWGRASLHSLKLTQTNMSSLWAASRPTAELNDYFNLV